MEQLQDRQWCNQYAHFCIHIPTLTILHKINIKCEFIYAAAGISYMRTTEVIARHSKGV